MVTPYVTAGQLAELRSSLTAEEWQVLRDVQAMRLATARDLHALHALRAPLNVRSFRRLLRRLVDQRLLAHLPERSIGGRRAGSAGWVHTLGPAGRRLLLPGDPGRRPWTPRPSWLNHAVAVSHLYVELRQLEAVTDLKLRSFDAEPACWRTFTGRFGEHQVLKPDAFVVTTQGGYQFVRFIEVDLATESPATLVRKLTVYYRYYQSGIEQLRHDLFPEVLWLVPTDARRATFLGVVDHQPPEAWRLHRIARYDQAGTVFAERPP